MWQSNIERDLYYLKQTVDDLYTLPLYESGR